MFKTESFLFKNKYNQNSERHIVVYHSKRYIDRLLLEDLEVELDPYTQVVHPAGFPFTIVELDQKLEEKLKVMKVWESLQARLKQLSWLLSQENKKQKFIVTRE